MAHGLLVFVEVLAASVWIGGLVAIAVVARIARAQLDPADQIAFFRTLGRSYAKVGTTALVIALAAGAGLLAQRGADAGTWVAVAVGALLVATSLIAMRQARAMTRLRRRGLDDPGLLPEIHRGARRAMLWRGGIAGLTLALLAVGATLAA
jgi:uncharacterized membrane protein